MRKAGLAHAPDSLDAARDAHVDRRLEFLGGFRRVLRYDLGDRVRKLETLAVGAKSKRFNFTDAAQSLFKQVVFEGQCDLLEEIRYYNRSLVSIIAEPLLVEIDFNR